MSRHAPTASELKVLHFLDQQPMKVASSDAIRKEVQLTVRGGRVVFNRMVDERMIGWTEARDLTLTFGGMQVLKTAA